MLDMDCENPTVVDAAVASDVPPKIGGIELTLPAGAEWDGDGMSLADNTCVSRGGDANVSSVHVGECGKTFVVLFPLKIC